MFKIHVMEKKSVDILKSATIDLEFTSEEFFDIFSYYFVSHYYTYNRQCVSVRRAKFSYVPRQKYVPYRKTSYNTLVFFGW